MPAPREYPSFYNAYTHSGVANFFDLRDKRIWFADKTEYLTRWIEDVPDFAIFRRPARFGKSSWLSVLAAYYDILTDEETRRYYFYNLQIGDQQPSCTYLILHFDFTAATRTYWNTTNVDEAMRSALRRFVNKYEHLIGNVELHPNPTVSLRRVLEAVREVGQKVFPSPPTPKTMPNMISNKGIPSD